MKTIFTDTIDLLTFRITRERMLGFRWQHLVFGLICTWIVGIGRNWDDPNASILQHLGVGSVAYIFVLSLVIWIVFKPLVLSKWSYFNVLTFVSLVSPPAILYAIPVEMFASLEISNLLNLTLLAAVSIWRILLLIFFLSSFAQLRAFATIFGTGLLLSLIVIAIFFLNIEELVFSSMSGIRETSPNDASNGVLFLSFLLALWIFPTSLLGYLWALWRKSKSAKPDLND